MILKLSKKVFQKNSILKAIKDYSQLADIVAEEGNEYYYLDFHNCHFDTQMTVSEFENYLIEMEQ